MNKVFYIEPNKNIKNDVHESIIIHFLGIKLKCSRLIFNPQYIEFLLLKKFKGKHKAVEIILKKYIKPVSEIVKREIAGILDEEKNKKSDYVWSMWLQDDIPEIIQMCLDSIKKFYPNVIILNEKTINDYITIPKYILEKYTKGMIRPPAFSDYIRSCLLDKYGGTWIDASCFLQNPIPKFISKQNFFIFTSENKSRVSSFFIVSSKNNYLIKAMRIFQEEYWKTKNYLVDYFYFHRFLELICKYDKECNEIFNNMLPDVTQKVRYLTDNGELNSDEDLWNYLKSTSFLYKLNRKNEIAMNNPKGFYQYFIKEWKTNDNINNNSKL